MPISLGNAMPSPPLITPWSRLSLGPNLRLAMGVPASGVSPWDTGSVILACPFTLEAPQTTFYKGFWIMGSAGGTQNREVGIWGENYNKIITTGAVAGNNTNSVPQAAAFTATLTLPPGRYYMGMGYATTTTNTNFRWSLATTGIAVLQGYGCWREAGGTLGSLPATATPGSMTTVAFPAFGLITRSVFDL